MVNKEKVLAGLKSCADRTGALCRTCPYDFVHNENCMGDMARDALELLKEQEAVEPIPPTDESDLWRCGNCNRQLFRCTYQKYCENCGKKVKWE